MLCLALLRRLASLHQGTQERINTARVPASGGEIPVWLVFAASLGGEGCATCLCPARCSPSTLAFPPRTAQTVCSKLNPRFPEGQRSLRSLLPARAGAASGCWEQDWGSPRSAPMAQRVLTAGWVPRVASVRVAGEHVQATVLGEALLPALRTLGPCSWRGCGGYGPVAFCCVAARIDSPQERLRCCC